MFHVLSIHYSDETGRVPGGLAIDEHPLLRGFFVLAGTPDWEPGSLPGLGTGPWCWSSGEEA